MTASIRGLATALGLTVLLAADATGAGGGACCLFDDCVNAADEAECNTVGGVFLPGEDCAFDPCGIGACCFEMECGMTDAFSCITAGRTFGGAGTTCLDDPCEAGVGACCLGEACDDLSPEACDAAGGLWLGAGTACDEDPCTISACCFDDDSCRQITGHECAVLGGEPVPNQDCAKDPCGKPGPCPDALFSQAPDPPDDFTAGTSEASAGFRRFEDYTGIAGSITALRWWGLDLDHVGGGVFEECAESNPRFTISFHVDAGGVPGDAVCSYDVLATRTPTNIFYLGTEMNEYAASLPSPCVLVNGWVSIVGLGDPECWFLWMSAGIGDSYCEGCSPPPQDFDVAVCLFGEEGGVFGACCDDADGTCTEDVEITECAAVGLRFVLGGTCADLDPPCGTIIGACCFGDATCSIEEGEDCASAGGSWLGPNSICASCPCLVPCPGGGVAEGEPVCFDGYIDEFNGGCTALAPTFSAITLGSTACGTSGLFDDSDGIDFDWYALTIDEATEITLTARAEFVPRIWILDAGGGCPGDVIATDATTECLDVAISAAVEPGPYWVVIAPNAFTDSATCGAAYTLSLTTPACDGDIDGDGSVGFPDLLAILAAWGPCPGCPEDIDGDSNVGLTDLLTVLSAWGPCP